MLQRTFLLGIVFFISVALSIAFAYLNYRYKRRSIDYYMMFIIGIAWTILGLVFELTFLVIAGGFFTIWGYIKRNEWDEDLTKLKNVHRNEIISIKEQTSSLEIFFTWLIFIGAFILIGIIIYIYIQTLGGKF